MQKAKALIWLFPENIRRVKKQADSYFLGGGCSGNYRGKTWGLISLGIRALATWPCHGWNSSLWLPALILCCPLLLLPPIPPSIRVFSNESALHIRWSKYWSCSFNISPSNEHPGLISFRMDWLDLFAVQRTLKSLLQHHSSKASILLHSAFIIVQLSHLYMTTGKTTAFTRQTFVSAF